MTVAVIPVTRWVCPNCPLEQQTNEARPHIRYHACPGLRGLTAPMVPAGTRVKVSSVEREDYINGEHVTTDATGRPVMAVITEREDGTDVAVFASTATARAKEL